MLKLTKTWLSSINKEKISNMPKQIIKCPSYSTGILQASILICTVCRLKLEGQFEASIFLNLTENILPNSSKSIRSTYETYFWVGEKRENTYSRRSY